VEADAREVGFMILGILKNLPKVRIPSLESQARKNRSVSLMDNYLIES
jgi:hypothetical protein